MQKSIKHIAAMLASEQKITLFTVTGEVIDLMVNGPHDTVAISEFLTPQITGHTAVEIDLSEYLTMNKTLTGLHTNADFVEEGQIRVVVVDGKEVRGIFFPEKTKVVVHHEGEDVEIPKVENLQKHIARADKEQSPSVRNFLRRMAAVAKHRLHSAEDLMDFIKKSELPLTDDGRIITYKRVKSKEGDPGVFVDCHSKTVLQRVGSRVWMNVDAVDPSRNQSCSHGLHVANLGYIGGFHGSNVMICLVDPADFIAVPHGETTKCRVCAYDVIGVMDSSKVLHGAHSKNQTLQELVQQAVVGNYHKPTEMVEVNKRGYVGTVQLEEGEAPVSEAPAQEQATEDTKEASGKSLDTDAPVKEVAKDLVKKTKKAKKDAKEGKTSPKPKAGNKPLTTRELGQQYYSVWQNTKLPADLQILVDWKKARKKGWGALGFNSVQEKKILRGIKALP